ncbi:MAG: hypothetical protein QOJ84_4311 [Bradyrhizobium sp.]|jgi:hypothetical protein|nr:hypothetical protein [Bradyrhizobium sp.]
MSKHPSSAASENAAVAKRIKAASAKREAAKQHASQNPFAVFTEWTGEADEKAYADL